MKIIYLIALATAFVFLIVLGLAMILEGLLSQSEERRNKIMNQRYYRCMLLREPKIEHGLKIKETPSDIV